MKMINYIFYLMIFFSMSACDPGKSDFNKVEADRSKLLGDKLTEENLVAGSLVYFDYKGLTKKYKGDRTAKKAKKRMAELEQQAEVILENILAKREAKLKLIAPHYANYVKLASAIIDESNKNKDLTFTSNQVKKGACIAFVSGSEFDDMEKKVQNITINKVLEVGEDEVLVKSIIRFDMRDFNTNGDLKVINKKMADSKYKYKMEDAVSCDSADKLANLYNTYLVKIREFNRDADKIKAANRIANQGIIVVE